MLSKSIISIAKNCLESHLLLPLSIKLHISQKTIPKLKKEQTKRARGQRYSTFRSVVKKSWANALYFLLRAESWNNDGLVPLWSVLYLLYIEQDQKIHKFDMSIGRGEARALFRVCEYCDFFIHQWVVKQDNSEGIHVV